MDELNINHGSITQYQVVCGNGSVTIGKEYQVLNKGDTFTVPMDAPYQTRGELIMLATSTPPFDINALVALL